MSYQYSKLREIALSHEKLESEYIIDMHTHTGGRCQKEHIPDANTDDMIAEMDRLGIDAAVTFSYAGITSDVDYGNDTIAVAVGMHPERFIGFACVNPHYSTEIKDELERCKQMGLRGVKLIAEYQLYPTEGPNLFPAYEYAHENSWIMLNHNWGSPQFLSKLASTFHKACFIIGHFSMAYADVIASHDNIFQCTASGVNFADIESLIDAVPVEKIVFGSNFPSVSLMFSMGPILYARTSDDNKRKILGLNAEAILKRWPGK